MATSTNSVCGICEAQHVTKCADYWCPECDEGLCNDCEKHHSISKASRQHGIISIEDYKKLPTDVSSIGHHCQEHEKKFQNYCPHHEKLCCPRCISTNHRECVGLLDLDEIVKTSKTSVLTDKLEKSFKNIVSNIRNIIIDRKINIAKIKEQRQRFHNKIKQVRAKINTHLDGLEQQIKSDLLSEEQNIKTEIETLLKKLSEKLETVQDLQNSIVAMKKHASDLQTFLVSKQLEERSLSEEKYLQSIMNGSSSFKRLDLKCSISDNIMNISDINSFGSISTDVSAPSIVTITEKDKQAQMLSHTNIANKTIEDFQITKIRQFKVPCKQGITGHIFCPNGDMVFVDYGLGKRLLIMDSMGTLKRKILLQSDQLYDVRYVDGGMVAVCTWGKNEMFVIDIRSGNILLTLYGECCGGLTHRGNTLGCELHSHAIKTADLHDNTVSELISEVAINQQTCVITSSNKTFVTCPSNNTVTCFKQNGDTEWQYVDRSMVHSPNGVTVDKHNNVYVSSRGNNSVVLITSDGKQARKILEAKDGIKSLSCVQFDLNTNNLLLTCFNGDAFLYNIS